MSKALYWLEKKGSEKGREVWIEVYGWRCEIINQPLHKVDLRRRAVNEVEKADWLLTVEGTAEIGKQTVGMRLILNG